MILTGVRPGEACHAEWQEFDLENKTWTIPAERMKKDRVHKVPLSNQAMTLLSEIAKIDEFVFPGDRKDGPVSQSSLRSVLMRMDKKWIDTDQNKVITLHGFRSTFRTWAADTGYSAEVAEKALAHVPGDKTVQAYERSQMFEQRKQLMQHWADYCMNPNVVDLQQKKRSVKKVA
jgi:integrase